MVAARERPAVPVDIDLADEEVSSIKRIVNAVKLLKVSDLTRSDGESSVTEMSLSAELAVMKYMEVKPKLEIIIGEGISDETFFHKGKSIEIQCRSKEGLAFLSPYNSSKWFDVDYGILVYRINDSKYRIHGVISGEMFAREHTVKEHGGIKFEVCGPDCFSDIALIR